MVQMIGYKIMEPLYKSDRTHVFHAIREADNLPVTLKILNVEYPLPEQIQHFKTEFELLSSLNIKGVIQAYALEKYKNSLAMVLEEFSGISLADYLEQQSMSIPDFLEIGVNISNILQQIHDLRILHKDLNPSNILWNAEAKEIRIVDFGISDYIDDLPDQIDVFEGTLAYLPPEQTGRTNLKMDNRSDLYALGATFYHLLTHRIPFEGDEAEIIHGHLAKDPVPPHELIPEIPVIISKIILKLMEKSMDQRYPSAASLLTDLNECLTQWKLSGTIVEFELAQMSSRKELKFPDKHYGRHSERQEVISHFQRICDGDKTFLLIEGHSGSGKTTFIHDIEFYLRENQATCLHSDPHPSNQNIPYSTIIEALTEFLQSILSEDEVHVSFWKQRCLDALHGNGKVLIDLLPDLEHLIDKQPSVPTLPPIESQNRLHYVFRQFLSVIATVDNPVVIFIDNLHLIDDASASLIENWMSSPEMKYLLIVGTIDGEISHSRQVERLLNDLKKFQNKAFYALKLSHLTIENVAEILGDVFSMETAEVIDLAETCHHKTGGTPFFLAQFVEALQGCGFVWYDDSNQKWKWNLEEIQKQEFTDNVISLMIENINQQDETHQLILKHAACQGTDFSVEILHHTTGIDHKVIQQMLNDLVEHDFIHELVSRETAEEHDCSNKTCAFTHSRIQQTAYSLMNVSEAAKIHLKVGQFLVQNLSPKEKESRIFEIVNHFNAGISESTSTKETEIAAQLNFEAGQNAMQTAAFQEAEQLFETAVSLLPDNSWSSHYRFSLDLHTAAATAARLSPDYERMEFHTAKVLEHAKTLLEKISVYENKIEGLISQNQFREAIKLALSVLTQLGISFPKNPTKLHAALSLLKVKRRLFHKSMDDLMALPPMRDPEKLAALRLINTIFSATYIAFPPLYPLLILKQVDLSLEYGNAPLSSLAYCDYALLLCGILEEFDQGQKFVELSLHLLNKYPLPQLEARIHFLIHAFIRIWKHPIVDTISPLKDAYYQSLFAGDLEYAGYIASLHANHEYFSGKNLPELIQTFEQYIEELIQLKQSAAIEYMEISSLAFKNLSIPGPHPEQLISPTFNAIEKEQKYLDTQNYTGLFTLQLNRAFLCYHFYDFAKALEYTSETKKYLDSVTALYSVTLYNFHNSLIILASLSQVTALKRARLLKEVADNQKKMKKWADNAPANFLHKYYLIEAERARCSRKESRARQFYNLSIEYSRKHGYIQDEALANELFGKFWMEQSEPEVGQLYLTKGRHLYHLWGADNKCEFLDRHFPQLLNSRKKSGTLSQTVTGTLQQNTTLSTSFSTSLDLTAIIKATQAITGEVYLNAVLRKIMQIVMENTGSQRSFFLVHRQGEWSIDAMIDLHVSKDSVELAIPLESDMANEMLPLPIVKYVIRTKEHVLLDDAVGNSKFEDLPYIQENQVRSLLSLPIKNRNLLNGIIYLENNLTTGAFTPNRLEVLKIMATQASISIENASLYTNLEQKVQERTQQLNESLQQVEQQNTTLLASNRKLEDLSHIKAQLLEKLSHLYEDDLGGMQKHLEQMKQDPIESYQDHISALERHVFQIEHVLQPVTAMHRTEKAIKSKRLLLMETNKKQQILAKMALRGTGVELDIVSDYESGKEQLEQQSYDIIYTNADLIDLAKYAHTKNPEIATVFTTSAKAQDYLPILRQYPFLSNIVSTSEEDRTFTIKNIITTVSKLLSKDFFGMEKYLNWGVEVHQETVTDSDSRGLLVESMTDYFQQLGIRKSFLTHCTMIAEELLMNAIYDAPHDSAGKPIYNHLPRTIPVALKPEEQGTFRYACDGILVAISCEDPFGALSRQIVLDYLDSCYRGEAGSINLEKGKGGAGRGLFQIMEKSDLVVMNVKSGIKTEVIAFVNISPDKPKTEKITSFHYFFD
ncbi:MAG: AAA family ATPase [SAR324 cluster bacterium]|nr:AAA family ATPase [SAR324 cluster bacterium]